MCIFKLHFQNNTCCTSNEDEVSSKICQELWYKTKKKSKDLLLGILISIHFFLLFSLSPLFSLFVFLFLILFERAIISLGQTNLYYVYYKLYTTKSQKNVHFLVRAHAWIRLEKKYPKHQLLGTIVITLPK